MRTLSFSDARRHIADLADPVESTLLTKNGKPVAVVLGIDTFRSMQSLLELTRNPERFAAIMSAHAKAQAGDLSDSGSLEELKAYLKNNNE